jgi:hypothetical protein
MSTKKRFIKIASKIDDAIELMEKNSVAKAITVLRKLSEDTAAYGAPTKTSTSTKPKKLNLYMQFAQANRSKVVKELAGKTGTKVPVTQVAIELGKRWQKVKETWKP